VRALQVNATLRVGKLMHVLHDESAVEFYSYSRHVKIHDVHCVL
jgi:hypothetical protein